jgi:DNA-binding NtrC family response regulator
MTPIMLVSGDRELVKTLKDALSGTLVRLASDFSNAKAAVDSLAAQPPALVVIDLFLDGGLSGLDALKMLKRVQENGNFVFLARMRTRTILERAFRLGAQDVLHYPVSTEILRDTILHRLEAEKSARKK